MKSANAIVWGIDTLCVTAAILLILGAPQGLRSDKVTRVPQDIQCSREDSGVSGEHSLRRVAGPSELARYWILSSGSLPVALLRDDDHDSSPDRAFLFMRGPESAKEVLLDSLDCEFWKTPISHFLTRMDIDHQWRPELAQGHRWVSFLEKLGEFGIWEYGARRNGLSVLDEEVAHRLFELLSDSVAPQASELNVETMWEQVQADVEQMLAWVGVRTVDVFPAGVSQLHLEGVKAPLDTRHYRAPMLYVKNASMQQTQAVFDVLLFNAWATQADWQRRISQSP